MKTSFFKKFFIFSIFFFIISLGYTAYILVFQADFVSKENIEISVLGKTFVQGGEELPLTISLVNKNTSPLESSYLIVEYDKTSGSESNTEKERLRYSLKTIPAGGAHSENIKLKLFGDQESTKTIKISLEYRVENSNAIFIKEKMHEISITSSPLNISIDSPRTISPNQDITLNIKASLNTTKPMSKVLLKIDYPNSFQFISSKPKPAFGNNIWNLGDMAPGTERNIVLSGKMIEVYEGEEKTFKLLTGSQSTSDKSSLDTIFSSSEHKILIKKQLIETRLSINGVSRREYASYSKNTIQGVIFWSNNSETKINNLVIKAKITGNAINRKSINAQQGFYDSAQDTIIWDQNSLDKFTEISPRDSGAVTFSFSPSSIFSASLPEGLLINPSINLEINISGQQEVSGFANQELTSSESTVIRIISDLGLTTKALYASGPLKNTGPIPPVVGKETTYTINWSITNTSNNVSNAQVRSTLPQWVQFVGLISPTEEDLTYDPIKREIVWNIGNVPIGAGINKAKKEVYFQVSLLPSLSHLNKTPIIINKATLIGQDDFTKVGLEAKKDELDTALKNEDNFPVDGGSVVESIETSDE